MTMARSTWIIPGIALFAAFTASAHHSVPAYFDVSKTVTVTGTLRTSSFRIPIQS